MSKHQEFNDESSDGGTRPQMAKEFLITFNGYGSITLTKEALQLYPSSLPSQLLLSDGVSDQALQLPIGRGLVYFPNLVKEIFDCGAPSRIPPCGLHFDLFVKWLKYLGLATAGRSLSTESESHKRVSFFVEVMINTLRDLPFSHTYTQIELSRISETETQKFVCMPPDIGRFVSDLVPFEFARRSIHMRAERKGFRKLERGDLNMSRLCWCDSTDDEHNFWLRTEAQPVFGTVTMLISLGPEVGDLLRFDHDGRLYDLSLSTQYYGGNFTTVELLQRDAGCCFAGRENVEFLVLLRASEINFLEEFKEGGMKYDSDVHGPSLISVISGNFCRGFPLQHGARVRVPAFDRSVLANGFLLVASRQRCPPLRYFVEDDESVYPAKIGNSLEWTLSFEESPAWALENSGLPPLG